MIGTYGIAAISADQPGTMVGARRGSPLIIGIGDGENFLTSDANAIVAQWSRKLRKEKFASQRLRLDATTASVSSQARRFASQDI